jgi:hypothetical protein
VPACKSGREWFDHLGRHCSFEDPVLSHLTAEVITIEPACDPLDARSKSPVACSMPVSGSTILTDAVVTRRVVERPSYHALTHTLLAYWRKPKRLSN